MAALTFSGNACCMLLPWVLWATLLQHAQAEWEIAQSFGQSCTTVCASHGATCSQDGTRQLNNEQEFDDVFAGLYTAGKIPGSPAETCASYEESATDLAAQPGAGWIGTFGPFCFHHAKLSECNATSSEALFRICCCLPTGISDYASECLLPSTTSTATSLTTTITTTRVTSTSSIMTSTGTASTITTTATTVTQMTTITSITTLSTSHTATTTASTATATTMVTVTTSSFTTFTMSSTFVKLTSSTTVTVAAAAVITETEPAGSSEIFVSDSKPHRSGEVDLFLLIFILAVLGLAIVTNTRLLIYYQQPEDVGFSNSILCKVIIVTSLTLTWMVNLLLPIDVRNSRPVPGFLDMRAMWTAAFITLAVFIVLVVPAAMFYYEVEGDEFVKRKRRYVLCSMLTTLIFAASILGISFPFLSKAAIPVVSYVCKDWQTADAQGRKDVCGNGQPTEIEVQVGFQIYLVSVLCFLGWFFLSVFGGIGLSAAPLDMILAFLDRPRAINESTYRQRKKMVGLAAQVLLQRAEELQGRDEDLAEAAKGSKKRLSWGAWQASRNLRQVRTDYNRFKCDVLLLEEEFEKLQVSKFNKGESLVVAILKLCCGIIFSLFSLAWVLQIILCVLVPQITGQAGPPFLNSLFAACEQSGLYPLGVALYACFNFYMLICVVKGCTKFGMRVAFFLSIHPMRAQNTPLNSILFNVEMLLISTAAMVQFSQTTFSDYARLTEAGMPQCLREHGRKVAIKRFHRLGSRTFMKELTALKRVGTHPNILRLLESYQGFNGEDVLVLEYCDGSTLYDLYAREHPKGGLPERLVARLLRQLFLALQHLSSCGVEHQDVKPENMMLFDVSVSAFRAELKLGDFGWAAIAAPEGKMSKPPPTGAGSLWYAPPELNPPVEGVEPEAMAVDQYGEPIKGLSDMWSAGVVLYLLLVGHNPFNQALKQSTQEQQDQEVLRLVALGKYNCRTERWHGLHSDARDLVERLLRVAPIQRSLPSEALKHPFVTKRTVAGRVSGYGGNAMSTCMDGEHSVFFHGSVAPWAGRERRWQRLDGFQRLAWLAMARALAEPELDGAVVQGALEGMEHEKQHQARHGGDQREAGFLWQLARELGTAPVFQWLQDRSAWPDAVRLAFGFLDVDRDGFLSASDLLAHVAGPPQRNSSAPVAVAKMMPVVSKDEIVKIWIQRWQVKDRKEEKLPLQAFREALLSSCSGDDTLFGTLDDDDGFVNDTEMEGPEHAVGGVVPHRGAELQRWGGDGTGGTGGSAPVGGGMGRPLSFGGEGRLAPGGI